MYRHFFKFLIDFTLSFIGFIVLLPFFMVITIILFFKNNGHPFFFQNRPGKNEKVFKLVKFKTMNDLKDQEGKLLPDSKRITPIGKFIRKTSLDEIPQLINVIKGDMSLIGPRPLSVKYLPLYNSEQRKRHLVKPGITGWAQVNGRNTISWTKKFEYDCWYVENLNLMLDIKILYLTIIKALKQEGVREGGTAEVESFTGTN